MEESSAVEIESRAAGLQPDEAAAAITVPGGFNVKLIAGEPQVHQPIAFTIDERGRIWVAEAHAYPRRQPTGKGKDKIVVFEDTDGDGSFESSKVFVDNLNLVSGLEVGFGGVWVGAPPYLMFIPDVDGDAVPDGVPKILLDGWGYQDTHELLNSFIWGPDGWLYGCQGIFTHSNIGKPGTPPEERIPMNCGVWRYHPTKHQFEVFAWGTSNPWGVDFDDHGQAFLTACVIPHLFHLIQGARYQRQTGRHFNPHVYEVIKTIADHLHFAGGVGEHAWWGRDAPVRHATTDKAGGGHAHCGAMIYLGDSFPEQYRNTFFTNNIHGNRVNNDVLKRKGSGYIGSHGKDFLLANDHWFRGINLKYGPDGSVYLIDWYDKNACHRVSPAIWDRTNGRIYKVGFGESKPVKVNLAALTDKELVQLHLHRNDWYVRTARRVLQQRAAEGDIEKETAASLYRILESNPEVSRKLRALWTLHATNALNEDTAAVQLSSGEEFIRAWVIQLLCEDGRVSEEIASKLGELSKTDPSPTVRLYLASALQRLPLDQRWPIAEGLLGRAEDANDRNLPLMVWYGIEPLVTHDPARALSLIKSSKLPKIPGHLARRAAADPKARTALLASLAEADGADQFMILEETVKAIRNTRRIPMPAGWPGIYKKLMQSKNKTIRHNAQYVTIKFGDKQIYPILRKLVAQKLADLEDRRQALKALIGGRDPMLPGVLFELLDEPALRIQALRGLAEFGDEKTPEAILSRYKKFSTAEQSTAISTLSTRPKFTLALLSAIEKGDLPRNALSAFTVRQILKLDNEGIPERLNKEWGVIRSTPEEKVKLIAQLKEKLTPQILKRADLASGRELFDKTCAACHTLFGSGGKIGPDITGSNRADLDYILENLIDPSAIVGRDYQMTIVKAKDERIVTGIIAEENDTALVLQTQKEKVVIDKSEIADRKLSQESLMPEGQLTALKSQEIEDLIAYLRSPSEVPLPGTAPVIDPKTGLVAGAIEGETIRVVKKTRGEARSQKMHSFRLDKWSGTDHLWWTGGRPGDKLEMEFPVRRDGVHEVYMVLTKAIDYGIVQLYLDGEKIRKPIDLYNNDVISTGPILLCKKNWKQGKHRLTAEITGAHPKAVKAYMFGLDYIWLRKISKQ